MTSDDGASGSRSPTEPRYPFVHVEALPEDADAISALLFDLGATGVEERDASTMLKAPEGKVLLVASFDSHADALEAIELLAGQEPPIEGRLEEIVGDAWRDAYKEFFKPFSLTPGITIKPPWCEAPDAKGAILELEPGRAFGTGLHATTSLVARILEGSAADLAGKEILDAGTGSGILSLVALTLGAARAVAFDVDAEVIPVVVENAERNALASRVRAFAGTIDDVDGTFPWVVANIEAKVLDPLADKIAARVAPRGSLVLSGILASEERRMVDRYTSLERGFELVEARLEGTREDGWVALHLRARA